MGHGWVLLGPPTRRLIYAGHLERTVPYLPVSNFSFSGIRSHMATILALALGVGQMEGNVQGEVTKSLCQLFSTQILFNDVPRCGEVSW